MSKSRHVAKLQGMVLCHSTGRETEARETNFPITLWPLIQTEVSDGWNGRRKGIGMAPKAWVTDGRVDQTRKDLRRSSSCLVQPWLCSYRHAQRVSPPPSMGTTHVLLSGIHSCTALVTLQPSAAGEGWWIHINVHPGKQARPQGSSMIHF